jgi:hypothetical protein
MSNDTEVPGTETNEEGTPMAKGFNLLETLTASLETFTRLAAEAAINGAKADLEMYNKLIERTADEFYSFLDTQEAMDRLSKQRAEMIIEIEGTQYGPSVSFEADFDFKPDLTEEDNVVSGAFGEWSDPDDAST